MLNKLSSLPQKIALGCFNKAGMKNSAEAALNHGGFNRADVAASILAIGKDIRNYADRLAGMTKQSVSNAYHAHINYKMFQKALGPADQHVLFGGEDGQNRMVKAHKSKKMSGQDFSNMTTGLFAPDNEIVVATTSFEKSIFDSSRLSGYKFFGCDFTDASFESADLRGVDFTQSTGLTIEQLANAQIDHTTKLPQYIQVELESRVGAVPAWAELAV